MEKEIEAALAGWRRYADFSGRSGRREYWMFVAGVVVVSIGLGIIDALIAAVFGIHMRPLSTLFTLAAIVPSIAAVIRRFHDQDKSGWFAALSLIPFLGGLIVLVFMCLEGTQGPNQYGPDPREA
ncbi:MAG: DUF805 domain-containing protein [Novosphingobium sp.]|jgi:uncharacterized membrane protein YhaH (DUF805 family)|nr:DUF805 domain-containing protein [Novosphingobium sp.]